eukprot:TRINITY_DN1196_c1_g2_i1.p1 TRINITY_DN1196_c1_g2~~TRINITY_DN1196_c1_g2_i1.p1  ORF type:complete len:1222 (-),score=302.38 TRINITY_DN1196_c1_g2_i1:38-3703(-)
MVDDELDEDDLEDDDEDEESEEEDMSDEEEGMQHRPMKHKIEVAQPQAKKKSFLATLRDGLNVAPFDTELHVALVDALRQAAELDKLREARLCAASRVALPDSQWMDWLEDERRLASDADFDELDALHKKACAAHPCSSTLWLARCSLYREMPEGTGQDSAKVRAVYEEALEMLGQHPTEARALWDGYRDYEETLLAGCSGDVLKSQVQRVRALFFRQLVLPLPGVAELKAAHEAFEAKLAVANQDTAAKEKAQALAAVAEEAWQERAPLEDKLRAASRPSVSVGPSTDADSDAASSPAAVISQILAFETTSGDDQRITLGHLRATQLVPKELHRWLDFAAHVSATSSDKNLQAEVLERALRHFPGEGDLWLKLHAALEHADAPLAALVDAANRGIFALQKGAVNAETVGDSTPEDEYGKAASMQALLLQHADACRRVMSRARNASAGTKSRDEESLAKQALVEMRVALEFAVSISDNKEEFQSLKCQALLRWLRLEAYGANDVEGVLKVGSKLMEIWSGFYNVWSTYIAAVRSCAAGSRIETLRDLFKCAAKQVTDYPDQAFADYVEFERECGTLQSWRSAQAEDEKRKASAQSAAATSVSQPSASTTADAKAAASATSVAAEKRRAGATSAQPAEGARASKRQRQQGASAGDATATKPAPKAAGGKASEKKTAAPVATETSEAKKQKKDTTETPAEAKAPSASGKAAAEAPSSEAVALAGGGKKEAPPSTDKKGSKEDDAAPSAADKSESKEDGEDDESNAPHLPHRGYHYHQLKEGEEAAKSAGAEGDRTVYVSCLDWSVDEPQLRRLFDVVDGLKDVRLVKDFLQRSKGYAYIDFETSAQVDEAVAKLNGKLVNERAMKVARSLPTKPLFEKCTIFVTNVAAAAKEQDVRSAFAGCGEIREVRMPGGDKGQHKGYAYVEFTEPAAVEKALEGSATAIQICDQKVDVSRSIPMKDHRHQTAAPRRDLPQRCNQKQILEDRLARQDPVKQASLYPTTVYVKNIALDVDEEKLRKHFESCGTISQVLVVANAQGRSRGFGFVEFEDANAAQAALALTDSVLSGREIVVSRSQRAITKKKGPKEDGAASGKGKGKEGSDEPGKGKSKAKGKSKGASDDQGQDKGKAKGKGKTGGKRKAGDAAPDERGARRARLAVRADDPATSAASAAAKKEAGGSANASAAAADDKTSAAAGESATEASAPPEAKPLSNADFRAFLLNAA